MMVIDSRLIALLAICLCLFQSVMIYYRGHTSVIHAPA